MKKGKAVIHLAADLAVGSIATQAIAEELGDDLVSNIVSGAGGIAAGIGTGFLLESLDKNTGIVSDVGSLVDDIFDLF